MQFFHSNEGLPIQRYWGLTFNKNGCHFDDVLLRVSHINDQILSDIAACFTAKWISRIVIKFTALSCYIKGGGGGVVYLSILAC